MATEEVVATSASNGIRFGDTEISSVMLGDAEVESVYLGDKEVYSLGAERPENLTLLMHLNGSLTDETGKNTPAIYGTETYQDGKFKKAIALDGTNCIKIPYSDNIVFGSDDFTIAGWFYWDGTRPSGNYPRLFSHQYRYSSSQRGIHVEISEDKTPSVFYWAVYRAQNYTIVKRITSQTTPVNEWFHLAIVRNGTTITLYFNGKAIDSASASTYSIYQNSNASFKIGAGSNESATNDTPQNFLSGAVDEFIIAKKALWTADFTPPARAYKDPPKKRVGGTIFYIGSDNGNTYRFFDKDKNEITDITTTGLADAYYYTVEGEATTDRFYVWDKVVPSSGTWGYSGTSLGATGTAIGTGKANTETVLARTDIPTGSIWELIKKKRTERINGCSDWYIGSDSEVAKFISSYSSKYQSYPFWSSSESSADNAYQWYYTYNNRSGTTSKGWGASAKSGNGAVVAIRSF